MVEEIEEVNIRVGNLILFDGNVEFKEVDKIIITKTIVEFYYGDMKFSRLTQQGLELMVNNQDIIDYKYYIKTTNNND